MELKTCKCCGRSLPIDSFHIDRGLKDGHRNICKKCACAKSRESDRRLNNLTNGLRSVFSAMKKRCYSQNHHSYKNYGGRGITICSEWMNNPKSFYDWSLSNGFKKGLQIDRIDTDGNYCPENCRFVTPSQNQQNRRDNMIPSSLLCTIRELYASGMRQFQINEWIARNTCKGKLRPCDLSKICRGVTWKQ